MKRTASPLAAGIAACLLLVPAIWNGSPFYYWDSVDYVHLPFTFDLPVYRTMPYGMVTGIGRLSGTLWSVIVFQALLTSYAMHEFLDAFAPGGPRRWLVPITAVLVGLTALPWTVGLLMPDAFTAPAILAMVTLAFSGQHFGGARRIGLTGALVVAIIPHSSHWALSAGLAVSLPMAAWAVRHRMPGPAARSRMLAGIFAVVASLGVIAGIHGATTGRIFVSQPTYVLWSGLLVQTGLAKRLLDDTCKTGTEWRLCPAKDSLPATANSFLWDKEGHPTRYYGSWEAMEPEARRLVTTSLRRYPVDHLIAAGRLTVEQLVRFRTGDGVESGVDFMIKDTLKKYYPANYSAWQASRQAEKPGINFDALNRLHVPATLLMYALLIVAIFMAWRRRDAISTMLAAGVLLALLGNAIVCGALSNPNDRYQARVAWLAGLAAAVCAIRLRRPAGDAVLDGSLHIETAEKAKS